VVTPHDLLTLFDPAKPFASKAAITSAAMRFNAEQLRALIVELAESPDKQLQYGVLPALMARWAELDPRGLLELAFAEGTNPSLRGWLIGYGFAELTRTSPEDARDFALRTDTDGDNERKEVLRSMFAVLAETDPTLALRWLDDRSLVPEKDYEEAAGRFYGEWAERDPVAAGASVLEHPSEWAVTTVAEIWVMVDPEAVAAWGLKLESPEQRGNTLEEIIRATGEKDGGAFAMSLLDSFFPGEVAGHSLGMLGRAVFGHDVDKGLAWIATLESDMERYNVGINTADTIASEHPERLGDYLAAFQTDRTRRGIIERLAGSWGRRDADAAVAWARTLEAGADREAALFKLVELRPELIGELGNPEAVHHNDTAKLARSMNATNGIAATQQWIDGLPTASQRNAAWAALLPAWTSDPLRAIEFLNNVAPSRPEVAELQRRGRIGRFVGEWGKVDPAAAGAWAAENGFRTEANELQSRAVIEMLATGDHELAAVQLIGHLDALAQISDDLPNHTSGFNSATSRISRHWARRDPAAAGVWALSIESGAQRLIAARGVAAAWAEFAPQDSLEWGLALEQGHVRETALRSTFDSWADIDPDGARSALDAAAVSVAERAAILEDLAE
jgi:hypothetical protein